MKNFKLLLIAGALIIFCASIIFIYFTFTYNSSKDNTFEFCVKNGGVVYNTRTKECVLNNKTYSELQ
jgi:hypothetical protein